MIKKLFKEFPFVPGSLKAAPQTKTCVEQRRTIKNRKWTQLVAIAVAIALCGAVAEAQQPAKVFKIGWLASGSGRPSLSEIFHQRLRALGYVKGKNISIEYRFTEGKLDRLPALADELVRLKVDVLVAVGTASTVAAKNATKTIPIVFFGSGDPVALGLVDSLARPGGNLTGFTNLGAELVGKRLELLKDTVHTLSRVAVLWDPRAPSSAQEWKESLHPARELGLQLHSMEVGSADKFESAFKEATKARSAALAVTSSALNNLNPKRIADLAAKHRLPAIYHREEFVANGGLMSYGTEPLEAYRRAAEYVDKILKGTKPADLPVERPMGFEFIINLKTAKALGLTIPPIVLMRATKVVK